MCSHASLGRYKDQIFIVVLSETFNFVSAKLLLLTLSYFFSVQFSCSRLSVV